MSLLGRILCRLGRHDWNPRQGPTAWTNEGITFICACCGHLASRRL